MRKVLIAVALLGLVGCDGGMTSTQKRAIELGVPYCKAKTYQEGYTRGLAWGKKGRHPNTTCLGEQAGVDGYRQGWADGNAMRR